MGNKIRFYTTDSNLYWKQCKYCGAFCQLVIDGRPTGRSIVHHGDCAVQELENVMKLIHMKEVDGDNRLENNQS